MRLGTCVAIELALGATVATAAGITAVWGVREVRSRWEGEAQAAVIAEARRSDRPAAATHLEPPATLEPVSRPFGVFGGVRDDILLAPLREGVIEHVKFNRGGSSISLRLTFESGARAAFKPRQDSRRTIPRREVAAYRIDRLLGLSAVPPAVGRAFPLDDLLAAVGPESERFLPRLEREIVAGQGRGVDGGPAAADALVIGELSWWIPVIRRATVDGLPIDEPEGIAVWTRYLTAGEPIPASERRRVAQISEMVVFDFVINNFDRWSGANTYMSEDGRVLYFMDNTLSFGLDPDGTPITRSYLHRAQKFSRSLVRALRHLSADRVRNALARDVAPLGEILSEGEIEALVRRRDRALAYIDSLIEEHGEGAVMVFP